MRTALGCLGLALLLALASNVWLAHEVIERWTAEKELRLDPLGLRNYPDAAEVERPTKPTLVVFGDSRAWAWSPPASRHGFALVNRGVGRETSAQALERFETHVAPLEPQVVLIQVGVNDLTLVGLLPERREAIVESCRTNIERIVRKAQALGAAVVLTTIFPVGDVPLLRRPFFSSDIATAIEEVNSHLRELAGDGVLLVDSAAVLAGPNGRLENAFATDWLHLSPAGYEALNVELDDVLRSLAPPGVSDARGPSS